MKTFRRNRWRRVTTCPSKRLLSVAALSIAAVLPEALPLQAQERQPEQQAGPTAQQGRRVHVVRKGDTLWDLASFYLSDPFLWPEIYRLNTMVVEDPHWIYPDERLVLPGPGEVVQAPEETRVPGEEVAGVPEAPVQGPPAEIQELKTIFVPRQATRRTLIYRPTPPVPARTVTENDYYRSGVLAPLDELGPRGQVIDLSIPGNVPVKRPDSTPRYGRIYVSHPDGQVPEPGDRVLLWRPEHRVSPYGWVVRPTGVATIVAVHEDVSTAVVVSLFDRVQVGNQASLLQRFEMKRGVFAEPVAAGPSGHIVALLDDQWVPSVGDIAFVDVGKKQGVTVGDEFEIFVASRTSPEGLRLPEEHVARGRVVRVTEKTATLRLIEQRRPAIAVGLPVRLVAKMPSS